jgi:hypothetical protein
MTDKYLKKLMVVVVPARKSILVSFAFSSRFVSDSRKNVVM